ncbi:MAG: DUF3048 domain-containing protein [Acidimicrobiia bacterium]
MNDIAGWIKTHRWETTSGVLGALLAASLVVLLVITAGSPEEVAATTITTTTGATGTTVSSATTTRSEGSAVATTSPGAERRSGVTAVVVDNVPGIDFQIGIGSADLLIETPVEGGLSRFTALYGKDVPDLVGPVRSLRPVSADLLAPFRPIVFATGGQRFVVGAVIAAGATVVTPESSIAFQTLERPEPHNVFVSPSTEISETASIPFPWSTGEWAGGEPVSEVTVPIDGGAVWRYEDGVYVRYRDGQPVQVLSEYDGVPEPLTRDTLVVLSANMKSAGYTDSAGADVPTFDVVGGGDVYVLHGGEMIRGTWFRASQADGYQFNDARGNPMPIPENRVYLAIVPDTGEVQLRG